MANGREPDRGGTAAFVEGGRQATARRTSASRSRVEREQDGRRRRARAAPHSPMNLERGATVGLFDKLFRRKQRSEQTARMDRVPQEGARGREMLQSSDERQATRGRMEAELDAQRERRSRVAPPDA